LGAEDPGRHGEQTEETGRRRRKRRFHGRARRSSSGDEAHRDRDRGWASSLRGDADSIESCPPRPTVFLALSQGSGWRRGRLVSSGDGEGRPGSTLAEGSAGTRTRPRTGTRPSASPWPTASVLLVARAPVAADDVGELAGGDVVVRTTCV